MATNLSGIRIMSGALDEIPVAGNNRIVLRGVIDPACLPLLRVDDYQREPLPLSSLAKLWQALRDGESLPDIELACRTATFLSNPSEENDFWLDPDSVYIIDGQQRRNAAVHILSIMPDLKVRIGAMIHFGTNREWERERFKILNLDRSKVSANVLLRNMRHQSAAILTLYGLSHNEPDFPLFERVCWKQTISANELITARTLVTVAGVLHTHRSPAFRNTLSELVPTLDRQAKIVKLNLWRTNIVYFFDLLDECFGIRKVALRELSLQTRAGFMVQLALLLSDHQNFWRGERETELYLDAFWRKRLATFPIRDPGIMQMISTSNAGYSMGNLSPLYSIMRDHLNRGLSSNRLTNRKDEAAANAPKRFSSYLPDKDDDQDVTIPKH